MSVSLHMERPRTRILIDRVRCSSHGLGGVRFWSQKYRWSSSRLPRIIEQIGHEERTTTVFILSVLSFRRNRRLNIEELYRRFSGTVARRVRRFVGPDDVEEVVHDVFLKALERQDSFRGDASPTTWIYHIATNHCLNRIRDQKRRRQSLELNKDLPWLSPTTQSDAETHLLLEQLWASMSEEQSLVAMYYYVDGMTQSEIARVINVSRRTVGYRLEELTEQLKALSGGCK